MNIKKSFVGAFVGLTLSGSMIAQVQNNKVDFEQVGKEIAKKLGNRHYVKLTNAELGPRIFKLLLKEFDSAKVYFTQKDVEMLRAKYGKNLSLRLLNASGIKVAHEMHDLYIKRVKENISYAQKFLKESNFKFDSDRELKRDRQDAEWAVDAVAQKKLWEKLVESAVLSETLRRDNIKRLAMEQGKKNPLANKKPIKELVSLKYKMMLMYALDENDESIADNVLDAIAGAYGPHSDYYSMSEYRRFQAGMNNGFVGIGAQLKSEDDGATRITGIMIDGPSHKGGVLALNDRIVGVDHLNDGNMVDVMFMRIDKVVEKIRGPKGTSVGLKIETKEGKYKIISIKRGAIETKGDFASGEIIESKNSDGTKRRIGYLRLPSFYINFQTNQNACSEHVKEILLRMTREGPGIDGLVFDLRGNGGGSLDEVRKMSGFFTGRGTIVQERDSQGKILLLNSRRKAIYGGPMVCLIDTTSASASEILAGALQDHNRAVIVGTKSTFGKGTVQNVMDVARMLPFNALGRNKAGYLKPTTRKFYRVTGSSTQNKGVESDIVLPNLLDAIKIGEKYMDYALPFDVIKQAPGFQPRAKSHLFMKQLREKSLSRIKESKDFIYISEDVNRMKKKIKHNIVSLNSDVRHKEITESDKRLKTRNKERIARLALVQKQDNERYTFYRVKRRDLIKPVLPKFDPSKEDDSIMLKADDPEEDLDISPKWPSGLDPVKRESLSILNDLINYTIESKVVKLKTEDKR